ncbi:TetR/AcrR family transcriptional regulator [Rhodococcus sp. MEB041]|uniref:TetR/AcrR family transcriptional regulator n=1 Tax=Rhodococcus sp. MEB041 TaxID=3040323 RepID=UPI00254F5E34|nr:TetR/AcrR family transcriptional regulator [Rhodococcus sp. MEB041]
MTTQNSSTPSTRRVAIADAVIELLAEPASRRVTHRAVDRRLTMPEGSTSAYFRTRAALLAAAARRLAELDHAALAELGQRAGGEAVAVQLHTVIAEVVKDWTSGRGRMRQLARMELQLEARGLPELAETFARQRTSFLRSVEELIATEQPALPPTDIRLLASTVVALIEGLISDRLLNHSDGSGFDEEVSRAVHLLLTFTGRRRR